MNGHGIASWKFLLRGRSLGKMVYERPPVAPASPMLSKGKVNGPIHLGTRDDAIHFYIWMKWSNVKRSVLPKNTTQHNNGPVHELNLVPPDCEPDTLTTEPYRYKYKYTHKSSTGIEVYQIPYNTKSWELWKSSQLPEDVSHLMNHSKEQPLNLRRGDTFHNKFS